MIKLGTSPHPKNDRKMYEDFFSKSTFKSPLLKNHQQTHNNNNDPPTKPYMNSQQIFNKAPLKETPMFQ